MDPSARDSTVVYPVRDDTPMGESDQHIDEARDYAVNVLKDHFGDQPEVYVSGNNFIYYVQGEPRAVVSPDAYVVRGVAGHLRDTFKVWEEGGRRPCFTLEVTSKSTRHNDLGEKMSRYRDDLLVPEYFLFDPRGDWIPEFLRAFRLVDGVYHPIEPNAAGRLPSEQLGLELARAGDHLRFYPPGSENPLPTRVEKIQHLEAELDRLRGQLPG